VTTRKSANGTKIPKSAREVRLAKHAEGKLTLGCFEVAETAVPEPGKGEVVVRTDYVLVAAAFQDMMRTDCQLPIPPFQIGQRMGLGAVGTVMLSNSPALGVGDLVMSMSGWSEYSVGPAEQYFKIDAKQFESPVYYLSQGPTAYYGMADIAKVGKGDVVFVSGAAGGVGSLAGQVAKCRGAKMVIGSAGSKAKVDYLVNELGFDAAFDYHDGSVVDNLRKLAPDGIDVFFDTVGGEQFEAAVQVAARSARFALCGALSAQNTSRKDASPRLDLMTVITQDVDLRGFCCMHTPEQLGAWAQHFGMWLAEGKFVFPHTIVEGGIEQLPHALIALLQGKYQGNVSLRVAAGD
jgi:NADPH-dependent curcumin reductase CurA